MVLLFFYSPSEAVVNVQTEAVVRYEKLIANVGIKGYRTFMETGGDVEEWPQRGYSRIANNPQLTCDC